MPLNIIHRRANGRVVRHSWWVPLLLDFTDAVEEEGGKEELDRTGQWIFREDHSYTHEKDQGEPTIRAGDKVQLFYNPMKDR